TGSRISYDAHNLATGCSAHNGIVDQPHALTFQQAAYRVQLQLYAKITNGLGGFDERAAYVVVPDQPNLERDAGFLGESRSGGDAGIRHRYDYVSVHGMLLCQVAAQHFAAMLNRAAKHYAIGSGKINMLENALGRLGGRGSEV